MEPIAPQKPTEQLNLWGLGATLLVIFAISQIIDMNSVSAWVERAGIWGPALFILLKISTIVIAPLSGSPLYPLVGLLFGFWPGIAYVVIGDSIGYTTNFFLSRFFGQKLVGRFISSKEQGLLAKVVNHIGTPKGFLQACLTMFAMPEFLCYAAGLTRLRYIHFISIMVPIVSTGSAVFVFIGSLLTPGSQSFLIGFALPIAGLIAVIIGGGLFAQSVRKQGETVL